MPFDDIRPYKSPLGGVFETRFGAITAGEDFERGEPIGVVDAGTLTEPPQDADEFKLADIDTVGNICGIAAYGPGAGNIDPMTGVAMTTGGVVHFYPADQGTLFITDNFYAITTPSTRVVPALTDIGEIYMIVYSTTAAILGWGIQQEPAVPGTDVLAVVHDVLDSQGTSVHLPNYNGTGASLVFEMKTK